MLRIPDRFYWVLPLGAWTVLILLSLGVMLHQNQTAAFATARQQGRDIFHMIEAMRLWNSEAGGVFMRQSASTPPNKYLELPERDPVTTSGIPLTTVNPAYMTRQMAGVIERESGIRIHITSLRPINPGNLADPWETAALQAFEKAAEKERSEILHTTGDPVIRYMAPLYVRKECLKCHQKQTYSIGDVRGGISVSIPATDFVARLDASRRQLVITHAGVWALVALMLTIYLHRYRAQWTSLKVLTATLEDRVRERTAKLEEESAAHRASELEARQHHQRFLDLVNTTDGIVWEADARTFVFGFVSRKAESLLGYPIEDWRTPGFWVAHLHPEDREWAPQYCASCTGRLEPHRFEYRFIAADGRVVWLEDIVTVVAENGEPKLLRGLMVDITARREAELEVRHLTQRLTLATRAAHIGIWEYEPHSGKVVWDSTMYELYGLSPDEFSGRFDDVLARVVPEDVPHLTKLIDESLRTGSDFVTTFRILRHGTEIHHIDAQAVLVPGNGHQPVRMIGVNRDVTDRKRNEQELLRLATTDVLTGCYNRGYLQRMLELEIDRSRRHGDVLSLLMYDLDRFKTINDTWGHGVGDAVLADGAAVVRETIRRTDTLARWGGEEFMVLCPRTPAAEAKVLAERVLQALREHPTPPAGVVTASIGVVTLRPEDGADTLLKRADDLMYRAKESGRNNVCCDADAA
ncbi:PAS domain S-box-containing protein/diguanylate cyclase (GGDEF) domain-containing protein [Aromatoleum tolulyticum]|uniref:PAS domain S-box-containing protein/diguanylate cyclase (GGDEF) domain-containing protein n=1 Tax=Aromatoleum tolulyticum TaxID=34027 RepID=A0A1N6W745_9RHOO|nr:diguanylate cyclase [Aromatoleum tolulyticum]SIQ85755.1 PAS domain S-box-containing protein/diguanylate cyclase (GGDEF) domain-containing protein [Aromatoleum tolulyticum]